MLTNKNFLGIEIGGTKLQLITGNADGGVVTEHRFNIKREDGAEGIREIIRKTVVENYSEKIAAVGIGFGGPVNWKTGQITASFHVEGWSGFNIATWLEPIVKAPVFVENDANVAALGEAILGAGRGYEVVLYITIGSGVGGGLVVNQQIYHGAIPGEIEIGHVRLDRSGKTIQSCCSGWAVDAKIRNAIARDPAGVLARLAGNATSAEAVYLKAALDENDIEARKIFNETTDDLAFGISHAIHLLHPEIVILGGGLSLIGEIFSAAVRRKIPDFLMSTFNQGPVVKLAELKEQSVPVGALLLARNNFHKSLKS
jgi:glucokinase